MGQMGRDEWCSSHEILPTLATLPSRLAREFAGADLVEALARPPWHVGSTAEISSAAKIPFGRLGNYVCRGQFVRAEPRHLFRLKGNRSVFRLDRVTLWLSSVPLAEQALRYLARVGLTPPPGADVREHICMLERCGVFSHAWRPRDLEAYLKTLLMK